MQDHRKLTCWMKAAALAERVYVETRAFPPDERFGLTLQMRRAAVSVMANIAEGRGRMYDRDFARFLGMALGSALELQSHLFIAKRMAFIKTDTSESLDRDVDEVKRVIFCLHRRLQTDSRDA